MHYLSPSRIALCMAILGQIITRANAVPLEQQTTENNTPRGQVFYPVSYENVYGGDPLGLKPYVRMEHCTVVDKVSADALREETAQFGGAYELKQIDGHYVVMSTGSPPKGLTTHPNHLDVLLTLKVERSTVWEALKQFKSELAKATPKMAPVRLDLNFLTPKKPDAVWNLPTVTFKMTEQPAREVLLEILGLSEVPLAYEYTHRETPIKGRVFPHAFLTVYAYNQWGDKCAFETVEGLLIPFIDNDSYHGKTHERLPFDGILDGWVRREHDEANKDYNAAMQRLRESPPPLKE